MLLPYHVFILIFIRRMVKPPEIACFRASAKKLSTGGKISEAENRKVNPRQKEKVVTETKINFCKKWPHDWFVWRKELLSLSLFFISSRLSWLIVGKEHAVKSHALDLFKKYICMAGMDASPVDGINCVQL